MKDRTSNLGYVVFLSFVAALGVTSMIACLILIGLYFLFAVMCLPYMYIKNPIDRCR